MIRAVLYYYNKIMSDCEWFERNGHVDQKQHFGSRLAHLWGSNKRADYSSGRGRGQLLMGGDVKGADE